MKGGVVRGGSKEVCINQIVWIGCVGKLSSARVCCVVWIWWIQWLCWLWLFSVCVQISCVDCVRCLDWAVGLAGAGGSWRARARARRYHLGWNQTDRQME